MTRLFYRWKLRFTFCTFLLFRLAKDAIWAISLIVIKFQSNESVNKIRTICDTELLAQTAQSITARKYL